MGGMTCVKSNIRPPLESKFSDGQIQSALHLGNITHIPFKTPKE